MFSEPPDDQRTHPPLDSRSFKQLGPCQLLALFPTYRPSRKEKADDACPSATLRISTRASNVCPVSSARCPFRSLLLALRGVSQVTRQDVFHNLVRGGARAHAVHDPGQEVPLDLCREYGPVP